MVVKRGISGYPITECQDCGAEFEGNGRCLYCWLKVLAKEREVKEANFAEKPYKYAMRFGRKAIVEMLTERWGNSGKDEERRPALRLVR